VEGRDPYWRFGQQGTWTNKGGRWKGLCQGKNETTSSIAGEHRWSRQKVRRFGVKMLKYFKTLFQKFDVLIEYEPF